MLADPATPFTRPSPAPLDAEDQWNRVVAGSDSGLSREREAELARRIRTGDAEALDTLVRANLRFAVMIARRYQGRGLPMKDLVQEANTGIVIAARKFDETKGVKFISYAVWWVRVTILTALSDHGRTVRIPPGRDTDLRRIAAARHQLQQSLQREPRLEEIAAEAGVSIQMTRDLTVANAAPVRLDAPLFEHDSSPVLDRLLDCSDGGAAEEDLETDSRNQLLLARMHACLKPREFRVLYLYFGLDGNLDATLESIGHLLGVTRERIRQIKEAGLAKLRRDGALAQLMMSDAA